MTRIWYRRIAGARKGVLDIDILLLIIVAKESKCLKIIGALNLPASLAQF